MKKQLFSLFIFIFLFSAFLYSERAQCDQWVYRLVMNSLNKDSLESALFNDARDGKLDRISLEMASFIASGGSDTSFEMYMRKIDSLQNRISISKAFKNISENDRPHYIHVWLHRNFLSRYNEYASSLVNCAETGEYNCVSSTLLYNALLRRYGYNSSAAQTESHVFSVVTLQGRTMEVETTHPLGYNPGKQFYKRFKGPVEFIILRPYEKTLKKRYIDDIQLVATIYFNRSLEQIKSGNFRNALMNYAKGYILDPGFPNAIEYIADLTMCWAGNLMEKGAYIRALGVYNRLLSWPAVRNYSKKSFVMQNKMAAQSKMVSVMVKKGRFREAVSFVARSRNEKKSFHEKDLLMYLYTTWGQKLADEGKWSQARDVYQSALGMYPQEGLLQNNIKAVYFEWSSLYIKRGKWEMAERVYRDAIKRFPRESFYHHNLHALYTQWAAEYAKKGDLKQARKIYGKIDKKYLSRKFKKS